MAPPATVPASDRPELQRIDGRSCVRMCVCMRERGGCACPGGVPKAPGCHQATLSPRSQPKCPSHTWHWIYHVTRRRSERGLPLSAEVMEALDWCNAADEAGERLCVCRMRVWLAPNCTTRIRSDSVSSHTLLSGPFDWQDKTLQVQPYTVSDQDSLPLRCHPPFEPYH